MYDTDEPEEVVLHCDASVMKSVIDNFGMTVDTTPIDNQHFEVSVMVCTSPTFYRWVFGFGGKIKIVGPDKILEEYRQRILAALESTNS